MKKIENKQFDLTLLTHSLEQAKKDGTIVKKFGLQKTKKIKNVISKFNKFECANFVQIKKMRTTLTSNTHG